MSTSGHWFEPQTMKQLVKSLDALSTRTSTTYDRLVKQDLGQIETQLDALTKSDRN